MPDVFPPSQPAIQNRYRTWAVCALLLLAVGAVFGQTVRHAFINYDDNVFVCQNPHVAPGLTGQGIAWALTHLEGHYWIPLTRLSSMLDCQLYGLRAGGHHLTNVLLHAATTILLFLVFRRITGDFWPSALVAALFAMHPLHVESVAWVTERKDVLSGLFFVLTLWTYVWYASGPFAPGRYLLLLAVFTLGLTAKPMLATLPFVLLLLDYWPLRRLADRSRFLCQPVLEKLPLLLLAAIFSSLTSWTMRGSLAINEHFPFWQRLANALVAYVSYLGQSVYPAGLAIFYPHPEGAVPVGQVLVAAAVLVLISVGAVAGRRRCPYLLVGWLWYLGMLVPVIGVVQLGWCARADRFTYLPQIGLAVALAWGAADLCRSWSPGRWACGVASALMLAALTACAWRQTCSWYDSETLWTHALACTSSNWMAHEKLGDVFLVQGHVAEAVAQYRKTLEIKPDGAESHVSLANALGALGRSEEGLAHLRKALEIQPDGAEIHYNLANALAGRGQIEGAVAHYRKLLELKPDFAEAQCNLATLLACRGEVDAAIACYQKALQIKPELAEARCNMAVALSEREKTLKALGKRRDAMRVQPNNVVLLRSTAWMLATNPNASVRNGIEAMALAERALQLSGGSEPAVLDALAAAYAEAGRFAEAAAAARKALALATRQNKPAAADAVRARMALYEAGKPYRQTPPPSPSKPGPATPKQAR